MNGMSEITTLTASGPTLTFNLSNLSDSTTAYPYEQMIQCCKCQTWYYPSWGHICIQPITFYPLWPNYQFNYDPLGLMTLERIATALEKLVKQNEDRQRKDGK